MVWKFEQDGREGQLFCWRDRLSCLQSQLLERRLIRASYILATPIISYFVFQNRTTSFAISIDVSVSKNKKGKKWITLMCIIARFIAFILRV